MSTNCLDGDIWYLLQVLKTLETNGIVLFDWLGLNKNE